MVQLLTKNVGQTRGHSFGNLPAHRIGDHPHRLPRKLTKRDLDTDRFTARDLNDLLKVRVPFLIYKDRRSTGSHLNIDRRLPTLIAINPDARPWGIRGHPEKGWPGLARSSQRTPLFFPHLQFSGRFHFLLPGVISSQPLIQNALAKQPLLALVFPPM